MRWAGLLLAWSVLGATGCAGVETVAGTTSPVTSSPTSGVPSTSAVSTTTDPWGPARQRMVEVQIEGRGVADQRVLEAMRSVPRHLFVPPDVRDSAYADTPLPIGFGQTISQPYVVALMTEAVRLEPGDRVLEIGTGSGYQAAVLAEMGMEVYSVEIIPELAAAASAALAAAGYGWVVTRAADGYWGWEENAPFDAIVVTAAPDHLPQPLVTQLSPGGRLVIPIGPVGAVQTLWVFEKGETGELLAQNLGPVRFVPFTRG